ncbi:MAG: aminoacyl-tRNA hydrolase [Bifidobacteriaceae bacterium]|nr:aminoacyl-tRNA hydrolase [Bifidobacteriaceae bacterium]
MNDVWLVVGLGNPGSDYARNRHNLGFMVADVLAGRYDASFAIRAHGRALAAAARIGWAPGGAPGPRAVLAKPQTFMNLSGGPVAELVAYFGVDLERVIVIHDDIDLPAWQVRLKHGGGEGGHNGLRDISKALGTRDFIRVRCGVSRPPRGGDAAAYVLQNFPVSQRADVELLVDKAADAVERVILHGLAAAQLTFHTAPTAGEEESPRGDGRLQRGAEESPRGDGRPTA